MYTAAVTMQPMLRAAFPGTELERARGVLSDNSVVRRYEADDVIAFEGDQGLGIGFVVSGTVLALVLSEHGREVVISTTRSGEPLHDLSWYDIGPIPLTLRTQHDARAEVLLIDGAAVSWCLRQFPAFRVSLLAATSRGRRALLERLRELSFYEVRSRVARQLLDAEQTDARVHMRRLAVATATVPEVAGRALRYFQREGIISLERGVPRIVDRRALHEAANLAGRPRRTDDDGVLLRKDAS